MKQQPHKHLLTYYTPQRCSAGDTQDLYLGFEELKPVLSILNKIQIAQKKFKQGGKLSEYFLLVDPLKAKLETLLLEDVEAQLEKEKK
ncbi:hypothetical protein NVP1187O_124 [Vibrio phage 1.187.O._10N.286.49.F1]|nr:hypothetical protein NVP1187O_124 [Vibrio phage 1.187.O._10N.286.49.F1]